MRKFEIVYFEDERHYAPGPRTFRKTGKTLLEAMCKLPDDVFYDVFFSLDRELPKDQKVDNLAANYIENDEQLIEYLEQIDIGGFSFVNVFEMVGRKKVAIVDFDGNEEDEDENEW